MSILVTGATGQLGRLVIQSLIERGAPAESIVAGARDVARAADLGVAAVHLDYTDAESIRTALDGVDTVLLISGSEVGQRFAQHKAVIDAAVEAGVQKFVYTSLTNADTSTHVLAPEHVATEEALAASGLPTVILRNNWYTENYAADLQRAAGTGVLASGAGDALVASAARRDYADAAAVVLLADGHIGEVYELAGDTAWNYTDLAAAFAEVLGRDVSYTVLTNEEQVAGLIEAGLDEGTAGFVAAIDTGIREGALAPTDGTLSRLIGRPTTSLVDALRPLV